MQIDLIYQYYFENKTQFIRNTLKSEWDVLILVVDGEYEISFKDEQRKVVLGKGDIMFIPRGVEFDREVLSPITYYHLSFYPQADHPFYLSAVLGRMRIPTEQRAAIFKTVDRAFLLPDNRELLTHVIEHTFMQNYLFGNTEKVKFKPFSDEVESALRYMRSNFNKKIDMDELAERVFLSHSGLIWKFKKELNTTPSNYLSILRLRYAKQLLLNHPYSITEISEMCGYSNPYYFTNAFHKYSGMSPTEFRKRYLEKKEK